MLDTIMSIVVEALLALLMAGAFMLFSFVWQKLKQSNLFEAVSKWIEANVGEKTQEAIDKSIDQFTAAADQLVISGELKKEERLEYVIKCLSDIGVAMTDIIRAKIEASVYFLPSLPSEDQ